MRTTRLSGYQRVASDSKPESASRNAASRARLLRSVGRPRRPRYLPGDGGVFGDVEVEDDVVGDGTLAEVREIGDRRRVAVEDEAEEAAVRQGQAIDDEIAHHVGRNELPRVHVRRDGHGVRMGGVFREELPQGRAP